MTELNTSPDARASTYDVRFTSRDGLLGWLQAWLYGQPLYGRGSVELIPGALLIRGHRRTWLGTPLPAELRAGESDLQDVTLSNDRIRCYLRGWYEFRLGTPERAAALFDELLRAGLYRRDDRYEAIRAFESQLLVATPRTVVTYVITLLNIIVFIALAIAGAGVAQVNVQWLIRIGANFGPLTTDGQWWRLLTAVFLHAGLLHLLFNTWALWNAGRLVERMYGSWTFLLIYVAAGTLASLTSTLWDPLRSSVGASGAIFGVLGAFLAFLAKGRTRLPTALVKAYAPSTIVFVLFNLVNGIINPIIDNAAHVGGLVSGFGLGWLLARSSNDEQREHVPLWSACAAILLTLAPLGAGAWYARPDDQSVPQRFWRAHKWYLEGEARSFAILNELEAQARAGAISDATFGDALERDVVPFWRDADARLAKEPDPADQAEQDFALEISEFVRLRHEWAKELAEAIEGRDGARVAGAAQLLVAAERARARISLVDLRAHADSPPGFSRSAPVRHVRSVFTRKYWSCVGDVGSRVSAAHAPTARDDGANGRAAASCAIQGAFSRRDFRTLEALLKRFNDSRGDLLDGDSRLAGVLGAFDGVFITDADWEDAFLRLGEWRRERPSSIWHHLLEVTLLQDWAWSARGGGYADSVAPVAWKAFAQRVEMAGTALYGCEERAASSPLWHELAIALAIERSGVRHEPRRQFDYAVERFPDYLPLYRQMIRALLPRWRGSHEEVGAFIDEMRDHTPTWEPSQLYARLFWALAGMEEDKDDLFKRTSADWETIRDGFAQMMVRHPKSTSILNGFAYMACRAGDASVYGSLRDRVRAQIVPSVWSEKYSLEKCDEKLKAGAQRAK